jgi:selenocysteine lyase/cysteine desulfurase
VGDEDRSLSFKRLFSRSLGADPDRLHFASHSHHLWPDASFDGQVEAWNDAARLADRKWDKVMDEVWPAAQREVAAELGIGMPEAIVFAPNTHDLLLRLMAAVSEAWPIRVLTSDGEFHSARRQFARWEESGAAVFERIAVEPFDSFSERFMDAALRGPHDLIFVSHVMFGSGQIFNRVDELAMLGRPEGPWIVIDGYHAFMAIPLPLAGGEEPRSGEGVGLNSSDVPPSRRPPASGRGRSAFYLGGGYKYAMSGEGCAFMHAPAGFGERPRITGWFAEFDDLSLPPGSVGYAPDARRFLGATFDPSGLYRFTHVRRMLAENGLTTARISEHTKALQQHLLDRLGNTALSNGELLNPPDGGSHARFLAFRSPDAQRWYNELKARNCITDVRGDVIRIGFGIYQDESDVDRLLGKLGDLK